MYPLGQKSAKSNKSFEPFPHNMGFNFKDGSQDIGLLLETLDMIPSVKEMAKCARYLFGEISLKILLVMIN